MRVAGLGFRREASLDALKAALAQAEAVAGPVNALATVAAKTGTTQAATLAAQCSLPLIAVDVRGILTPTQSDRVLAMHGTGSVAEAAALGAAGTGAKLVLARQSTPDGMVTIAIAEGSGDSE